MTLKTELIEAMARAEWEWTRSKTWVAIPTTWETEQRDVQKIFRDQAQRSLAAMSAFCAQRNIKLTAWEQTEEVKDLAVVYGWKDAWDAAPDLLGE